MLPNNELGKIAEYSNDIICTIDREGKFVWINRAVEKVLGYKPSEVIGKPYLDYVYEDDKIKTIDVTAHLLEGNRLENFVTRYVHKNGSIVSIEWTGNWDEPDQLLYCIASDKTDLIKTKDNYRKLFHHSPLPKYVYDLETLKFVDMNQVALNLYKYSRDELSNMTLLDLRPEEEHGVFLEALEKYKGREGDEIKKFGVFNHVDKEGKLLKIDVTGQKIELNGRDCALVIGQDITDDYHISIYKKIVSEISNSFNQRENLNESVKEIVCKIVDELNFEIGEIWLQEREEDQVNLISSYPINLQQKSDHKNSKIIDRFESGVGLPGITWKQKKQLYGKKIR